MREISRFMCEIQAKIVRIMHNARELEGLSMVHVYI